MPIYEYFCQKCRANQEILQKVGEKTPKLCPQCGAKDSLSKVVSSSSFHLKGGGWYKDLYASKKPASDAASEKPSEPKKPPAKSEE